ncbi:hypothetical protein [Streptomyces sp. NPDC005438]|uniref:hypothetical protein n=1 Tax=Streptomyces sp. NPDC005438 TaxID=3156880 RepID=UPI0033A8B667
MRSQPLRVLAIASCLPYLTLKVVWLSGGRIGIPPGSPLRESGNQLMALNLLTVCMDLAVVVLALLLTQPWGRRLPGWVLLVPLWIASGLLGPVVVAMPAQTLHSVLTGGGGSLTHGSGAGGMLDAWVWSLVYGGFVVQAVTLGWLFVRYAHHRWGHLPQGRSDAPWSGSVPGRRRVAGTAGVIAGVAALPPLTAHLLWATGATVGLNRQRIEHLSVDSRITEAVFAGYCLAALLAALVLGLGGWRWLAPTGALALGWLGSAVPFSWGGWVLLTSVVAPDSPVTERHTAMMDLTYAGQMIVGLLVGALLAAVLRERSRDSAGTGPVAVG